MARFVQACLSSRVTGKNIKEAIFSSPVGLLGFNKLPETGSTFTSFGNKKDAEKTSYEFAVKAEIAGTKNTEESNEKTIVIPLIIKTSVLGTIEAITQEVSKLNTPAVIVKIIHSGVGNITENDIRAAGGNTNTLIVGFHVTIEALAKDLAERALIEVRLFDVIYKLTEWLEEIVKTRTPKITVEEMRGTAKILKTFSNSKDSQIVGGTVIKGAIGVGETVKILRHDTPIGEGIIIELQQQKLKVKSVDEGNQFGVTVKSKMEIATGDKLQSFVMITT
ncbi:MAG: translation initiation factor IF-2 [Parcubacteria group bacterium Greene0714_4]|nr:MAG: translation initiation factor IF-2 [Parcubacteria group bacterium Greene0714_4]